MNNPTLIAPSSFTAIEAVPIVGDVDKKLMLILKNVGKYMYEKENDWHSVKFYGNIEFQ